VEDSRLRTDGPKGALTDDLCAAIREHRDELLQLLTWGRLGIAALMEAAAAADTLPPGLAAELQQRQRGMALMAAYEEGGEAAVMALARPTLVAETELVFEDEDKARRVIE
jgi:hypothetical protein